jgi:hypothetical protein
MGLIFLTALGFALFVKCALRLIEFRKFRILKMADGSVLVCKADNRGWEEKNISPANLKLVEQKNSLAIVMHDGQSEDELVVTHGGVRAQETMKTFYQLLA